MASAALMETTDNHGMEDFASLLDEQLGRETGFEGSVVTGRVIRLTDEYAIVDVGLKSEGRVALKEFGLPGQKSEVKPGDNIELYVERYEDRDGSIVLSREKARREEAWTSLERAFEAQQRVNGTIYGRVKGGFTVDLGGAVAFLPGSQVDIRPVRDVGPLMGSPQPFQILKMDRARGNIVVSRRAVLEETRAEQRSELIQGLKEGMILDGIVKNITDYGAFVDLGGVDGLLHVTDIAWRRINHPSEALLTILAGIRFEQRAVPWLVGLYITSAYWFTASTSFANPAVAVARSLTDTFTGIRPIDLPGFVAAQLAGALCGLVLTGWLLREATEQVATIKREARL